MPVTTLYPELAELSGGSESLIKLAQLKVDTNSPEQALHLSEIALSFENNNTAALNIRLAALNIMLDRARNTTNNFSETGWLESRIKITIKELQQNEQ